LGFTLAASAMGKPPIFEELPFEEAREKAIESGKLLIVDATATWCGPCKNMDRVTWVDKGLVSEIEERAIAIQFDVDELPELAERLAAEHLPTIIVFRDGQEFDRIVGFRTPAQMSEWLAGVARGISSLETLQERAQKKTSAGKFDVRARLDYARGLLYNARDEAATDEYTWLWEHMLEHNPAMKGVRRSFVASEMGSLAQRSDKAREVFTALRDATQERLETSGGVDELKDWIVLNRVIDDGDATLGWVDRTLGKEGGAQTVRGVEFMLDDLLIDHGRYDVVGRLVEDSVGAFEGNLSLARRAGTSLAARMLGADGRVRLRESSLTQFRSRVSTLHAALLASGRYDEGWRVLTLSLDGDDSIPMRAEIVRRAHAAGVMGPRHLALLSAGIPEHEEVLEGIAEGENGE